MRRAQSHATARAGTRSLLPVVRVSGFVDARVSGPGLTRERGSIRRTRNSLTRLQPGLRARRRGHVPPVPVRGPHGGRAHEGDDTIVPGAGIRVPLGSATILRGGGASSGPEGSGPRPDPARPGRLRVEPAPRSFGPSGWLCQAEACRRLGRIEEGLAVLGTALDKVRQHGERFFEAELHRLAGTLLLATGQTAPRKPASSRRSTSPASRARDRSSYRATVASAALPTAGRRRLRLEASSPSSTPGPAKGSRPPI